MKLRSLLGLVVSAFRVISRMFKDTSETKSDYIDLCDAVVWKCRGVVVDYMGQGNGSPGHNSNIILI